MQTEHFCSDRTSRNCRRRCRLRLGFGHVRHRAAREASVLRASRCVVAGAGLRVSVYLAAAYAARQRYLNRMTEQVQFYAPDQARIPHSARGNRWVTVAYSAPGTPRAERKARAVALARQAFRLTAR